MKESEVATTFYIILQWERHLNLITCTKLKNTDMYCVVFVNKLSSGQDDVLDCSFLPGFISVTHNIVIIIGMSRFACVAPSEDQRNVTVHKVDGKPCFRTCKDINQGTELLVWPEVQKILNEPVENIVVTTTEELCKQEASQRAREHESLKLASVKQGSEGEGVYIPGVYSKNVIYMYE